MRLWQHLMNQQAEAAALSKTWRYWRIFIQTNNGDASFITLAEVQLRDTLGGADLTTPSTPALASTQGTSSTAANLLDGGTATIWATTSGSVANQWVRFDMGTPTTVAQVAMYPQSAFPNRSPKDFTIQGSDDGTTFTDVKSFTNITGWTATFRTFDL